MGSLLRSHHNLHNKFNIIILCSFLFFMCCMFTITTSQFDNLDIYNNNLDGNNDDDSDIPSYDGPFYVSEETSPLPTERVQNASYVTLMKYKMVSVNNAIIDAVATVWYPSKIPTDGYRVIAIANPTVGTSPHCGTTVDARFLTTAMANMMNKILNKGYVIITLDLEGLGVKQRGVMHPYLNLKSGAYSIIYCIKAFKEHHKKMFHGDFVVLGQSQGAHAALGAGRYGPKMMGNSLKAVVACAPPARTAYTTDVLLPKLLPGIVQGEIAQQIPKHTAMNLLADVLVFSTFLSLGIKAENSTFNYEQDVFEPISASIARLTEGNYDDDNDNGLCYTQSRAAFNQTMLNWLNDNEDKTILDFPGLKPKVNQQEHIHNWLQRNEPDNKKIEVPVMIIQGTADAIVPLDVANWVVSNLTALGTNVTYLVINGGGHSTGYVNNVDDYLSFIQEYLPAHATNSAIMTTTTTTTLLLLFANILIITIMMMVM